MTTTTTSAREELRHVCDILAKENSVKIVCDDKLDLRANYALDTKTITLGTGKLTSWNTAQHVGLLLHEIGHVHHTPAALAAGVPEREKLAYNVLEDMRTDEKLRMTYDGADLYLSDAYRLHELAGHMRRPISDEQTIDDYRNRVLALALLEAEGISTTGITTGIPEYNERAHALAGYMRKAKYAKPDDIARMAEKVTRELLNDLLPPEPPEPEQAQAPAAGSGKADPSDDPDLLEQVTGMLESHGHGITDSTGSRTGDQRYTEQDARAIPEVARVKRMVLAKIRENERTHYEHGKRRGLLNKKALCRTARDNYRIYRKRIVPHGKKYAVEIVLDTSGSMWQVSDDEYRKALEQHRQPDESKAKINIALYCTALLTRVFRGLGYPTGVTLYGREPATILAGRDQYIVPAIQNAIGCLTGAVYNSGDNLTNAGIAKALPALMATGAGRDKLLIVITDGGLGNSDTHESARLIERARRAGVHTMIFYVEDGTQRILAGDERRERLIKDPADLPAACVELIKNVTD